MLRQIPKIRHRIPTPKSRRIRLRRHIPILPRGPITPLRRRLRPPRPIEPPLRCLERRHLRLRVRLQELLVALRVRGGGCVGVGAVAILATVTVGRGTVLG